MSAVSDAVTGVPNPVRSSALARPTHPALIAGGQTWSQAELLEAVGRWAGLLAGGGIGPGQVVALVGPPSAEWVVVFHALGWVGATVAPLPPRATKEELARGLEAVEPEHLLLTHGLDPELRQMLLSRGGRFPTELPHAAPPPERFWPLDEPRVIVLTSGSTAAPRPVPLTTTQLLLSAFGSAVRLGHDPADRWLACLPLHHVGGLSILLRCALYGTTVVLHERSFDPIRVARALDAGEATLVSLVPEMLQRVLDARPARPFPPGLRAILLGGDATPPALIERCRALGAPVALTWGMTEAASQVATRAPGELEPEGGCGAPLPFVRVESEGGRLILRGPTVEGGELLTRDLGSVERGVVHVRGRIEEAFVSGGETVSVVEIEAALREHPDLLDAAVVAVEDARWGERAAALVVPRQGERVDVAALRAWCRQRLSERKVPERVEVVLAIPRSALGKVLRREARALLDLPPAVARVRGPEHEGAPPAAVQPVQVDGRGGPIEPLTLLETAAGRGGAAPLAERLAGLREWLAGDLGTLEAALVALAREREGADEPKVRRAARHLLLAPGKRIRPACLVLAARAGGRGLDPAVRDLAVASELVHAATLLHDDVIDEGAVRRGTPAARVVYGNSASVLAGDALFTEALRLVSRAGVPPLLDGLLAVIAEMVDAEALQLERRGRVDLSRESYLRVIRGKTAALFRWTLAAGGAAGGLEPRHVDALGRAGVSLGLAFQLVDDLLDLAGDPAETGKDAGADLRQGKVTWPLIEAAARDPGLERLLAGLAGGEGVVEEVLERARATGALEATRGLAHAHAGAARAALLELPPSLAREALATMVEAAVERVR